MGSNTAQSRIPIPVVALIVVSVLVVGLLLAQAASGFFLGIVRLAMILAAFVGIAFLGFYLWRRGDLSGTGQ